MALQFKFGDAIAEVGAIKSLASRFLDARSTNVLDEVSSALTNARNAPAGSKHRIEIASHRPLLTKPSEGDYEPRHRKGRETVVGEVSGHWDITTLGGKAPQRQFSLSGNASITMRVRTQADPARTFVVWKMEVGAHDSPGCYFHSHTSRLNADSSALPVPRLPNVLFTFGDCIEFLLGELFQDRWVEHVAKNNAPTAVWRKFQKDRMVRVLDWQKSAIDELPGVPAWTALKIAKPQEDLFVR